MFIFLKNAVSLTPTHDETSYILDTNAGVCEHGGGGPLLSLHIEYLLHTAFPCMAALGS